jgi:FKBP-type peptidyl-prolyl cis-trans isomerase
VNSRFPRSSPALAVVLAAITAASFQPVMAQQSGAPASSRAGNKAGARSAQSNRAVKDKGSYSLGVLMGAQLRRFGIPANSVSFDKLSQGVRDVVKGTVTPSASDQKNVQDLMQIVMQDRVAAAGKNEAAARKFLAENAKRKGVVTTPSGLQYKILSPGSGASPRPTDEVTVNYRGTLLDGTEFDSSYKRGQPADLQVSRVIPGWKEALVLMKPGAKWELYIPPQLAYGTDSPSPIPPGSMLKFEVELLSVRPAPPSPGGAGPNIGGGTP